MIPSNGTTKTSTPPVVTLQIQIVVFVWYWKRLFSDSSQIELCPMGKESFQCCECGDGFDVDWGEGVVRQDG